MRSITGCILPIFSESLFLNLGYGWGGTVLACISIVSHSFGVVEERLKKRPFDVVEGTPPLTSFVVHSRPSLHLYCCGTTAHISENASNSSHRT